MIRELKLTSHTTAQTWRKEQNSQGREFEPLGRTVEGMTSLDRKFQELMAKEQQLL